MVAAGPALTSNGKLDFAETMRRTPGLAPQYQQGYNTYAPPGPATNRQGPPAFMQPNPMYPQQGYGQPQMYAQQPQYPGYPNQGYGTLGSGI